MASLADLEDFVDLLEGPFGVALVHVGDVIRRKLSERDQALSDLTDAELTGMMHAALLETAEALHPGEEGRDLCQRLDAIFAGYALDLAATAEAPSRLQ